MPSKISRIALAFLCTALLANQAQSAVPVTPVVPATPGVPVTPVVPAVPGVPVTPVVPATPEVPVAPGVPVTPVVPARPAVPVTPGVSGTSPSSVVPGRVAAALTYKVGSTVSAHVTFDGVPKSDGNGNKVYIDCRVRAASVAGDQGGAHGYIVPCTEPAQPITLKQFKKAGSVVKLDLTEKYAGAQDVWFEINAHYDGYVSPMFYNQISTPHFNVEGGVEVQPRLLL